MEMEDLSSHSEGEFQDVYDHDDDIGIDGNGGDGGGTGFRDDGGGPGTSTSQMENLSDNELEDESDNGKGNHSDTVMDMDMEQQPHALNKHNHDYDRQGQGRCNRNRNRKKHEHTGADEDGDGHGDGSSSSTDTESETQDQENETIADEEIDALLDARLPEDYKGKVKQKEFSVKEITVLEEKGKNNLEVLPDGWIEIRHLSGLPLYLHRKSRVCTLAKPYCLGPSSVRKHSIPLSAIPCLSYRRALDREKTQYSFASSPTHNQELNLTESEDETGLEQPNKRQKLNTENKSSIPPSTTSQSKCPRYFPRLPAAKVETAEEANTLFTIQPMELREYCSKLFHFKTVKCKRFTSWNARRKHTKTQKRLRVQRPTLPDGVKLIKFPIKPSGNEATSRTNREYILNPKGKSSVCILHEYVQHALRQQPSYLFRELEHASTPYSATVVINEIQYGTGYGSSKKQAKSDAARETLEVLIPEIKGQLDDSTKPNKPGEIDYTEYFDQVGVHDPRITTLCQNISEPTPYALLLTCIQRNYGQSSDSGLNFEMVATVGQVNKFRMTFRDFSVEITAPNKREGKQLASQSLLHKIHPHINNFGAFVRLYGNTSIKSCKEKKQEQQQITTLQSKASSNSPNYAILQKLREEMRKLMEEEKELEPFTGVAATTISTTIPSTLITGNSISPTSINDTGVLPASSNTIPSAPNPGDSSISSTSINNSTISTSDSDENNVSNVDTTKDNNQGSMKPVDFDSEEEFESGELSETGSQD